MDTSKIIFVLVLLLITALVSGFLCNLARLLGHRLEILDRPEDRSSHKVPTPRTGGIGVFSTLLLFLLFLVASGNLTFTKVTATLILGLSFSFAVGLFDDVRGARQTIRFLSQLAIGILLFSSGLKFSTLDIPPLVVTSIWIALPVTLFLSSGVLNMFNFMDGLDGLLASVSIVALIYLGTNFFLSGDTEALLLAVIMIGALLGYLLFNFPPATLFMGDSGSLTVGFFFLFLLLHRGQGGSSGLNFWGFLLPLGAFMFDVTVTLWSRFLTGKRWYRAHRSHFYQRANILGVSHRNVTFIEILIAVLLSISGIPYLRGTTAVKSLILGSWVIVFVCLSLWIKFSERSPSSS